MTLGAMFYYLVADLLLKIVGYKCLVQFLDIEAYDLLLEFLVFGEDDAVGDFFYLCLRIGSTWYFQQSQMLSTTSTSTKAMLRRSMLIFFMRLQVMREGIDHQAMKKMHAQEGTWWRNLDSCQAPRIGVNYQQLMCLIMLFMLQIMVMGWGQGKGGANKGNQWNMVNMQLQGYESIDVIVDKLLTPSYHDIQQIVYNLIMSQSKMPQHLQMDTLYSQNLALGTRINTLSDQNNFYKIQINNFNKLTNSINKDLYKLGINFQNKQIIEDSIKVGPLFVISNKIKLKNLQLKIGNSIRYADKFRKGLEGSLPAINKEVEGLEQEISMLAARCVQLRQENELLRGIGRWRALAEVHEQLREAEQDEGEAGMLELEARKKEVMKKLEFMKKEQKEKMRIFNQLITSNESQQAQVNNLKAEIKKSYPEDSEFNRQRALQAKQLESLQNQQKKLLLQIANKSKQLEQQYAANKQAKQRITEKKYQENKEIKVLEEEVLKCREQVREFKQKYRKIKVGDVQK